MFLVGSELTEAIRRLTKAGKVDCAVAFWGDGAEGMFRKTAARTSRIVCNLRMGGTNPRAIRRMLDLAQVRHCDALHAKIYLGSTRAIVTSANASANGLGIEGASSGTWIEAGYLTTIVAPIRAWFEGLWESSNAITEADLDAAEAAWSTRQQGTVGATEIGGTPTSAPDEPAASLVQAKQRRNVGAQLNVQWKVGAQHALYRSNGTWYHWLRRFPGALFDDNGYIRFETEHDLLACPGVLVGERANWLNVPNGIASLAGYTSVHNPALSRRVR
jgi:hypothetical protein